MLARVRAAQVPLRTPSLILAVHAARASLCCSALAMATRTRTPTRGGAAATPASAERAAGGRSRSPRARGEDEPAFEDPEDPILLGDETHDPPVRTSVGQSG